jgi:putative endonuclease
MFFTGDEYFVYIIANATRVLYIGMTNNLPKRFLIHRMKLCKGFTSNFHTCRLVYYEIYGDPTSAIHREKQLKGWRRAKKVALIEKANRDWHDLSDGWYDDPKFQGIALRLRREERGSAQDDRS